MVSKFEELGLCPQLIQTVTQLGFEQPTPIQEAAIPALLAKRNVVGQAQTGTGKTAAFVLPMLQNIQPRQGAVQALILAPTRELAIQVAKAANSMASTTHARVMVVYGGQPYQIQIRQIQRGVDVVVGTPGRLMDLMNKEILDLSQVSYLVLDEADEMLAMGFIEDVETILKAIPGERQIALFSATMPDAVRKLAARYMSDPHKIAINPTRMTVAETEQRFCLLREDDKCEALIRFMEVEDVKSALVFTRTKARAQELADELAERGISAESLHGDLNQSRREFVLNRFRQQTIKMVVATDVAARGLDIEDVSHVINFDMPDDTEDYIHRIGRTGRAGRKGIAITFATPRERGRLRQIEAITHQTLSEIRVPTREEILERRDELFLARLTEHLGQDKITHERALIARLAETSFDLVEIAAAAIRLARAGESELPQDKVFRPIVESPASRPANRKQPAWGASSTAQTDAAPRKKKYQRSADVPFQHELTPRPQRGQRQAETGMVRLRMNLGNAQGVRASDVVGAIATEVGIPGRAIGVIDIHSDYTFVDVSEKHFRQVLRESGGQYSLRGNPVMLTLAN